LLDRVVEGRSGGRRGGGLEVLGVGFGIPSLIDQARGNRRVDGATCRSPISRFAI